MRSLPILFLVMAGLGAGLQAAPVVIHARGDIRQDYTIQWTEAAPANGQTIPNDFYFSASDGRTPVTIHSDSPSPMTRITGGGGYFTTGSLLLHPAPGELRIYPLRKLQGFGVTIESSFTEKATYTMIFRTITSEYIGEATAQSSGTSGEPVFLGLIDPDARIEIIQIRCGPSGPNGFVLSDPVFQLPRVSSDNPKVLPVQGSFSTLVSPEATYLHEGIEGARITAATTEATEVNPNAHDLLDETRFPGLRGGDVLLLRSTFNGVGRNPPMALLSRTNEILGGRALVRVPGAVKTGTGFPTPPISGQSVTTPTDIGSDFAIAGATFVEVPPGSRYLMTTLAEPGNGLGGSISVDWIPRTLFENWLLKQGLVGSLAALDADIDKDGLSTIAEFAFGKDPTRADAAEVADFSFVPRPDVSTGTPRLSMVFGALRNAPLRYRPSFSSDLVNWQTGSPADVRPLVLEPGGDRAVLFATDPVGGPRRFGRLAIEYIPPAAP